MADNTNAAAPAIPVDGTPDTGSGDEGADIDTQLADFITPDAGDDTEFSAADVPEEVGDEDKPEEVKTDEAPAEEKKDEEVKKEDLRWTVKINGKEQEVDEQELIRGYQLGVSATQKFQEASKMRTDIEKILTTMKSDPMKILLNPALGLDFRKLAEDYLIEQLRMEQADPATKAQLMAERKLKELTDQQEAMKRQNDQAEMEKQAQAYAVQIDQAYTAALSKGRVPKTPTVVARMATINSQLLDQGYDPSADEIVDIVRREILQAQKEITEGMDPDQLEEFVGKDKVQALRKADIAKAQKKPSIAQQVKQFKPVAQKQGKHYISDRELTQHVKAVVRGQK